MEPEIVKLFKSFLYVIGYQAIILLVPILLSPYLSRVVGPSGIGTYSYTYSIVTLFGLFANLGVVKYGNREIAQCGEDREKRSQVFAELMSVKFVGAAVVLCAYAGFVALFGGEYRTALVLQTMTLASMIFDVSWFFWGVQQFRLTTSVCAAVKFLSVVLIFSFVHTEADVYRYIGVLAFSNLLTQLGAWLFLPRYIDFKPFFRYFVNRHWKSMFLLFFPVLAKYAYSTMDRIMLGHLGNITEVGYYENVQSIVVTFTLLLSTLGDVIMPSMTVYYGQRDEARRTALFRCAFHLITFLSVGTMFGFIGVSGAFIPMFYGDGFLSCVALLKLAAPVVVLAGYSDLLRTAVLLPQYRDREYITALAAGAVVNLVVNAALIPSLHSVGAVIGTVAAELLVLVIQAWSVRREISLRTCCVKTVIYCIMGGAILPVCAGVARLQLGRPLTVLLDIALGGAVYAVLTAAYLFRFEKDVFALIRRSVHTLCRNTHKFQQKKD